MSTFARGKLRHRITLQAWASTQDPDTGVVTDGWTPLADVWAAVEPLSGREFIAAQAQQSSVTARITIDYRPDVTTKTRVTHNVHVYDVQAVLPDRDSGLEYLTLMCSESTDQL